ncbi:histidine--tRNA ligase [Elstera cyanobacteriorum]|uniref:Histidine--tRNA ligase n=1 Tax=Elstera cyanobacteriorum TaxID=2022747 RepID=A0A255XLL6_9PROT|nr:histidine--tRNA ligase [Elstera cyanobacteriorum]OYQ17335.1 histidine--tRNA ligase [Elstera cyanobacteriorum]GFZ93038.1 histidine--tRNA ligase [Elstera cyanobacteriorum]
MEKVQPVRGTHDLLPDEARRHRHVAETARLIAGRYGFDGVATPIFEFVDVFARTVGETSDIVSKEMYVFTDRGGETLALRPEGTAGVVRALISNGLTQSLPFKAFYYGPMFRYERPQKGRLRQFHQIGVELIGPATPLADVEVITAGADILEALGLLDRVLLHLNTLGDAESRTAYRAALVEYFTAHKDKLSEDSLARLDKNPLRILDSKDEGDKALVAGAPLFGQYLTQAAQDFFGAVTEGLTAAGIAYKHDPLLVRGLDYYCHTAFEFVTTDLGAQGTVLAGGRYDGLVEQMGGPSTPGVGWAAGVERLAMLANDPAAAARPIALVPMGEAAEKAAVPLARALRRAGLSLDVGFSGNMKKRLARANKINAQFAIILGEDELTAGQAQWRDLDAGTQVAVALDALVGHARAAVSA